MTQGKWSMLCGGMALGVVMGALVIGALDLATAGIGVGIAGGSFVLGWDEP